MPIRGKEMGLECAPALLWQHLLLRHPHLCLAGLMLELQDALCLTAICASRATAPCCICLLAGGTMPHETTRRLWGWWSTCRMRLAHHGNLTWADGVISDAAGIQVLNPCTLAYACLPTDIAEAFRNQYG